VPWKDSVVKPVFYHCISRVVDRNLVFGPLEKEKFRTLLRMQENFTGCRVAAYCLMSNHIHLLLEVPPMPSSMRHGFPDDELLLRLRGIYNEAQVAEVAAELADARRHVAAGMADEAVVVARIHQRYTYRMHDLSEFMKTLMQRFTQWFNRTHERSGNLWEDAFKSVIIEDGSAARTIAGYIDLNPVRAGIVKDPAEYRWSSYGEAIGGGARGNGKKARAGLVRALQAHKGIEADASLWPHGVSLEYRKILMVGAIEKKCESIGKDGKPVEKILRRGIAGRKSAKDSKDFNSPPEENGEDIPLAAMLRHRVRYFTDGVVIGSRNFVNETFSGARQRFGKNRQDGARKLRGSGKPVAGLLWSLRDLQKGV
jgi:REP element-mobilizing transposase RayT